MTSIYKLGALPAGASDTAVQINAAIKDIDPRVVADGPGDVTLMSKGEFDRWIKAERMELLAQNSTSESSAAKYKGAAQAIKQGSIAGIGSMGSKMARDIDLYLKTTAQQREPAFTLPPEMVGHAVGGLLDWIKNAFKVFINWLVKGPMTIMSPYFIFLFLKRRTTKKIEARRHKQIKTFKWIMNTTKMDQKQLSGMMYNGILKKTGYTPQKILNSRGPKISGGFLAVIGKVIGFVFKAISVVINVIKKIVNLFRKKKSDAGDIGQDGMSDVRLLEELPEGTEPAGETSGKTDGGAEGGQETGGGSGGGWGPFRKGKKTGPRDGGASGESGSSGSSSGGYEPDYGGSSGGPSYDGREYAGGPTYAGPNGSSNNTMMMGLGLAAVMALMVMKK
ncbi:MAG: hypothetical protein AAFR05_22650 [Bacteroidota bacterium]